MRPGPYLGPGPRPGYYSPATRRPDNRKTIVVVGLVLVAILVLFVGAIVLTGGDDDDGADTVASKGGGVPSGPPALADLMKVKQADEAATSEKIKGFCLGRRPVPKAKPYVPGGQGQWVLRRILGTSNDTNVQDTAYTDYVKGDGLVVFAPYSGAIDTEFKGARDTTVAVCFTKTPAQDTGRTCDYVPSGYPNFGGYYSGPRETQTLFLGHATVEVFEIKTGKRLASGDITARSSGCPEHSRQGQTQITKPLGESDYAGWMRDHLSGGTVH